MSLWQIFSRLHTWGLRLSLPTSQSFSLLCRYSKTTDSCFFKTVSRGPGAYSRWNLLVVLYKSSYVSSVFPWQTILKIPPTHTAFKTCLLRIRPQPSYMSVWRFGDYKKPHGIGRCEYIGNCQNLF